MAKTPMNKSKIQVKPYTTTYEVALRGVLYRKLLKACEEKGGEIAAMAEDGVAPWNYAGAAIVVINAPFEFARTTDSPDTIFRNFEEWLKLPMDESAEILQALARNEPDLDPATAPPHLVTEEVKND